MDPNGRPDRSEGLTFIELERAILELGHEETEDVDLVRAYLVEHALQTIQGNLTNDTDLLSRTTVSIHDESLALLQVLDPANVHTKLLSFSTGITVDLGTLRQAVKHDPDSVDYVAWYYLAALLANGPRK